MDKIANRDASGYTTCREDFNGSNIRARTVANGDRYIVYSYGKHWPMYICDKGVWYENAETYSRATAKHKGQTRPNVSEITMMTTNAMLRIAESGIEGLAVMGEMR